MVDEEFCLYFLFFFLTVVRCQVLDVKGPSWGFEKLCPLSKLQENGVLEKDRLIIEVYINLIEAVDGESGDVSGKEETMDINGFQVSASLVSYKKLFFFGINNFACVVGLLHDVYI